MFWLVTIKDFLSLGLEMDFLNSDSIFFVDLLRFLMGSLFLEEIKLTVENVESFLFALIGESDFYIVFLSCTFNINYGLYYYNNFVLS